MSMPGLQGAPSQMTQEPMPKSQMTQEGMPQEVHLSVDHSVAAAMHVAANTNLTFDLLSFLPEAERWAHNLWLKHCVASCGVSLSQGKYCSASRARVVFSFSQQLPEP